MRDSFARIAVLLVLLTFCARGSCEDLDAATNASWSQVGGDVEGGGYVYESGRAVSLSDDGTRMAVGEPRAYGWQGGNNWETRGLVRVFELRSGGWVQIGSNITGDLFDDAGSSVALSGDGMRLAVGCPGHSPNGTLEPYSQGTRYSAGRAVVYEWRSGEWHQLGEPMVGGSSSDRFGWSVSLSYDGSRVAIGAYQYAMVFYWLQSTSSWYEYPADESSTTSKIDEDGRYYGNVDISGDGNRLVIAAGDWRRADGGSDAGRAARLRVFELHDGSHGSPYWRKIGADLPSSGRGRSPSTSLSKDGSIVSFSSSSFTSSCLMQVFRLVEDTSGGVGNPTWEQMGSNVETAKTDFYCGRTVARLSNDGLSIVTCESWFDRQALNGYTPSTVDLREWNPSTSSWTFVDGTRLRGHQTQDDRFGYDVALAGNGTRVAVGIPYAHTSNGLYTGAVRVYDYVVPSPEESPPACAPGASTGCAGSGGSGSSSGAVGGDGQPPPAASAESEETATTTVAAPPPLQPPATDTPPNLVFDDEDDAKYSHRFALALTTTALAFTLL